MNEVVLDASALLALLNGEPGAEAVEQAIPGAGIGAVNLSETVAKLAERGMPEEASRQVLGDIELRILPFDVSAALSTGMLRVPTRPQGLSLGDRACLALGRQLGCPVLTTDRRWLEVSVGVEVRLVR